MNRRQLTSQFLLTASSRVSFRTTVRTVRSNITLIPFMFLRLTVLTISTFISKRVKMEVVIGINVRKSFTGGRRQAVCRIGNITYTITQTIRKLDIF